MVLESWASVCSCFFHSLNFVCSVSFARASGAVSPLLFELDGADIAEG